MHVDVVASNDCSMYGLTAHVAITIATENASQRQRKNKERK